MTESNTLARQNKQGQDLAPRRELTLDMIVDMTGYSPAEVALVWRTVAVDAPIIELAMFLKSCRTLALDPILRQAYWIRRKQPDGSYKGALQVGIDGYRSLADRQLNYAGSEPATFRGYIEITYKGKKYTVPEKATVVCWKIVHGHKAAFTGEARWTEFYPGEAQGFMWIKMPHHQLAKCAEGQGLRKGWPALLGGIQMAPDMGENDVPAELEEVGRTQVIEQPQPKPERQKPTAADYDRIYGSAYPDEQQSHVQSQPESQPEPEERAEHLDYEPTQSELYDTYRQQLRAAKEEMGDALDASKWVLRSDTPIADIEAKGKHLATELECYRERMKAPEAESPITVALSRNRNLLDDAQQYRIPGLGKYKADESWPLDRIESANTALGDRIKERNGDAETAAKQDQVL